MNGNRQPGLTHDQWLRIAKNHGLVFTEGGLRHNVYMEFWKRKVEGVCDCCIEDDHGNMCYKKMTYLEMVDCDFL